METLFNILPHTLIASGTMNMKLTVSNRVAAALLIVLLVLSVLNTVLIFVSRDEANKLRDQLDQFSENNSTYDYVVFRDGTTVKARNGTSGAIDYTSEDASYVINSVIAKGSSIYIKQGTYTLSADIMVYNKKNAQIASDGAVLNCTGRRIVIRGDNYTFSQYNSLSGFEVLDGTVRIEDSFKTTITDMTIENSQTALELASTTTWSEGTKIENTHFVNCVEGIVFRTPMGNATGSYANTEISRCYFNLQDNSIGILVEPRAQFSDSQMQNVRIWQGEYGLEHNQTGILLRGTMKQTTLSGVVFESFALNPEQVYAINVDTPDSENWAPILAGANSFLGMYTARVYNPFDKWIYGLGGLFRRDNVPVAVGINGEEGQAMIFSNDPLTIADFQAQMHARGAFSSGETVTVKFVFEYIDHSRSSGIEKTFTGASDMWLNATDVISQYPSQNVLWAVLVTAKTNAATTNVSVTLDLYGATT